MSNKDKDQPRDTRKPVGRSEIADENPPARHRGQRTSSEVRKSYHRVGFAASGKGQQGIRVSPRSPTDR